MTTIWWDSAEERRCFQRSNHKILRFMKQTNIKMKLQTITIAACFLPGVCGSVMPQQPRGRKLRTSSPQILTDEEYDAAITDLELRYPWAFDDKSSSVAWISVVAQLVGQEVFSQVVGFGFDMLLGEIFPDPLDDISDAIKEISNSIEEVKAVLDNILDAIGQLQESADQIAFTTTENWAKDLAKGITSQFKLIDGWESGSYEYTASDVNLLAQTTYTAIEKLDAYLRGSRGTYELLQTLVLHFDQQEAVRELDEYRIGYRAVLATGILNLEWAAGVDRNYGNHLNVAGKTAHNLVDYLFDWSSLKSSLTSNYLKNNLQSWALLDPSFVIQPDGSEIQLDWAATRSSPWSVRNDKNLWYIEKTRRAGFPTGRISNDLVAYFAFGAIEIDVFEGTVASVSGGLQTGVFIGASFMAPGSEIYAPVPVTGRIDLYGTREMVLDLEFENLYDGYGDFVGSEMLLDLDFENVDNGNGDFVGSTVVMRME